MNVEDALRAGTIASDALMHGRSLIVSGASILEITERVEDFVREQGGSLAFPVQISLNDIAAHDVARHADPRILTDADVVKIDVGVHIDGTIADNALTVDLSGNHAGVVQASKDALLAVESMVALGTPIDTISQTISDHIGKSGYRPIANLSGHGLGHYALHSPPSIPNIPHTGTARIKAGMHFACEPFATDGHGRVADTGDPEIFMLVAHRPVRDPIARKALPYIHSYKGLPFCVRWLAKHIGVVRAQHAINKLMIAGNLTAYKPLREVQGGIVSQHEKTFLVTEDAILITTPWS